MIKPGGCHVIVGYETSLHKVSCLIPVMVEILLHVKSHEHYLGYIILKWNDIARGKLMLHAIGGSLLMLFCRLDMARKPPFYIAEFHCISDCNQHSAT